MPGSLVNWISIGQAGRLSSLAIMLAGLCFPRRRHGPARHPFLRMCLRILGLEDLRAAHTRTSAASRRSGGPLKVLLSFGSHRVRTRATLTGELSIRGASLHIIPFSSNPCVAYKTYSLNCASFVDTSFYSQRICLLRLFVSICWNFCSSTLASCCCTSVRLSIFTSALILEEVLVHARIVLLYHFESLFLRTLH